MFWLPPLTDYFTQFKGLKCGLHVSSLSLIVLEDIFSINVCCATFCDLVMAVKHFQSSHFCSTSASPLPVLTDYTGSEENIDISVLGLHSKLNLPLKSPLSHNHKPEAYSSRPGYSYSEQIHVDGGYLYDGVWVCVLWCCVSVSVSGFLSLHSSTLLGFNPPWYNFICSEWTICVQMLLLTTCNQISYTWLVEAWASVELFFAALACFIM